MAEVALTDTAKELLVNLGTEDRALVDRAVSSLADDDIRDAGKTDLMLKEDNRDVWAYEQGAVFISFVEVAATIAVTYLSVRTSFRQRIYDMPRLEDYE